MKTDLYLPLFIHSGWCSFPSTGPQFADFGPFLLSFLPSRKPPHLHMFISVLCSGSALHTFQEVLPGLPADSCLFSFFPDVERSFLSCAGSWEQGAGSSLYAPLAHQLHEGRVQSNFPLSLWHQAQCLAHRGCPVKGARGLKKEVIRLRTGIPLALETREN